jgi:hypothetical protein
MAWYGTGTVNVTNGSTAVTGTGTEFISGLQAGWGFVGPDGRTYEIASIQSATGLTLSAPYLGSTQTGQDYAAFPTQSLAADLTAAINTLISDFQGVKDGAGSGKFGNGTAAAPGMAFLADQDTGFSRPAANQLATSTGGVRRLLLSSSAYQVDVPITGTAVQASATDTTVGRLMAVGAFGLGADALPQVSDLNGINVSGLYRILVANAAAGNAPTNHNYVVLHASYDTNNETQMAQRIAIADPEVWFRVRNATGWQPWERVLTSAEVQSSATDTTEGKLLTVGAFGLGQKATTPEIPSFSAADTPAGRYHYVPTSVGVADAPAAASGNGMIVVDRAFANSLRQTLTENNGGSIGGATWSRTYNGTGGWSPWRKHYDSRNIIGTVSQSAGVPSGAVIERGSNANGEYVRFADGTQICTHQVSADAAAEVAWTFPAAFSATPSVLGTPNVGGLARYATIGSLFSSSVKLWAWNGSGVRANSAVLMTAIGRWF